MFKILDRIRQHPFRILLIATSVFFLPLLIIHFLFQIDCPFPIFEPNWSAGEVIEYVAAFESFIGAIVLGALALWQNESFQRQHIESLEPSLSMQLVSLSGFLYLKITNTGATEAKNIHINVVKIENNGDRSDLLLDDLFKTNFELYPNETVQGYVACLGQDIETYAFPKLFLHISYLRPDLNRTKNYDRTVIYSRNDCDNGSESKNYHEKILSDIKSIARADVRIANYLDGHQVAQMDEIDLLAHRSLRNDLAEVHQAGDSVPIVSRTESIKSRIL